MHQSRIPRPQLPKLFRVCWNAQNHGTGRFNGTQNSRSFALFNRSNNHQIVRAVFFVHPEIAAQYGYAWRLPLRLPACGEQSREFSVIGEDQQARVSQRYKAPGFRVQRRNCSAYSFSASSSADSKRFVLMPRFTAASVSFACFAASTRSCNRETSTRAIINDFSRLVALP